MEDCKASRKSSVLAQHDRGCAVVSRSGGVDLEARKRALDS